jgi:hypothetical protein
MAYYCGIGLPTTKPEAGTLSKAEVTFLNKQAEGGQAGRQKISGVLCRNRPNQKAQT